MKRISITAQRLNPKTNQNPFTSKSILDSHQSSMAKLSTAIDSSFWDLNVSSPRCHDGWAKSVPGDPFPVDGSVGSRILRPKQLSFFGSRMPLPIVPSLSPTSPKDLGSFTLQSLLLRLASPRWCVTTFTFAHYFFISYNPVCILVVIHEWLWLFVWFS